MVRFKNSLHIVPGGFWGYNDIVDLTSNAISHHSITFFYLFPTERWYAKRFLQPDVISAYDYVFIWDEDLGVEHFNAEK